ncbi:tenascin-R-like [Ruditapes philippinarum]|uniref:tenascin-R-like n=1 Tax=Ruditapes philippinarum TaxID=129788 RepID=UPI00295B9851|nr:tenascin-R-like [Ruditapes philippinarum]
MVEYTMILVLVLSILTWITTNSYYNYTYSKPQDCQDVQKYGRVETGVYTIYPVGTLGFPVRCDFDDSTSGAWTLIQRRVSASDLYKSWNEYQVGFGDLSDNFWLGNQQIHMITRQGWYELRIDIVSPEYEVAHAVYNVFYVGDAKLRYELLVDGYSGTAGDSMWIHNGQKFTIMTHTKGTVQWILKMGGGKGWYGPRIDIVSPENAVAHALYNVFYVGDAKSQYELFVDGYSGTAGDSLGPYNGYKFTTKDRDNDQHESNCAVRFIGAWWYGKCHQSNLNGDYGNTQFGEGLSWYHWKGYYVSMKTTEMKIRRWQSLNMHG